ncbi:hypothetical protein [Mucilaginibacter psychrotolerans]|uniref:Uncharacterized protein n=1 Tax=Mucilaginibacter psychrotolerans TaxID=1524096 RepID=A0A4Y8SMB9_9SPHI|nr:hypothetical protein [Mucilaginibacter psychrotolerans]TFF39604.1 hypothetical protein E2R66_04330 [Mucilaginibacter psychrotolerans]
MDKRDNLLNKIKACGFPEKEVFVSVAEFFDGNDDDGSIGCNIFPDPPSLNEFRDTLETITKDSRTDIIYVRIADIEDGDWFYTDTVYIAGDYTLEEIEEKFAPLKPDEVYKGLIYSKPSNIPSLKDGSIGYSVWWD